MAVIANLTPEEIQRVHEAFSHPWTFIGAAVGFALGVLVLSSIMETK